MSALTLLRQAQALRHRANCQVDSHKAERLHAEANEAWQNWLALQIADGLPRYNYSGQRVYDPEPPAALGITVTPPPPEQGSLFT